MKTTLITLTLFATLLAASPAQDSSYLVADFESGFGGFEGKISQDKSDAKAGAASGKIEGDFTNVTQSAWVTAKRRLDLKNEIKSLSFWVKTSDAKQLTVRIDDSTKQVFQQRPAITPNGQWQQIKIESFDSGPGIQSYGGAADKTVHWPATNLFFILEKNGLDAGKTAGAVWIDQVEFAVAGDVKSAAPTAEELVKGKSAMMLADFEDGTSGFNGKIEQDTTVAKGGKASGKIEAQLADVAQSAWVTVTKKLDYRGEINAVSFWVKSAELKQITVRIVDSTKQTLQVRPPVNPGSEWQQIIVPSFESGPGFQAYGGAEDKKAHWPAASLSFIVEKNGLDGGNGTVWIDNVEVFAAK